MLDRGQLICDPLHQLDEGEVDEQDAVFRVVDDVDDLLREEPRVHRVQHGAHARDAVEELQVAIAVPGERADPVAVPDTEPCHDVGDATRPALAFRHSHSGGSAPRRCARPPGGRRDTPPRSGSATRSSAGSPASGRAWLLLSLGRSGPRPRAIIGLRGAGRKTFACAADILAKSAGRGIRPRCGVTDRRGEDRETGGKDCACHWRFLRHRRGDRAEICRGGSAGRRCRLLESGQGAGRRGEN